MLGKTEQLLVVFSMFILMAGMGSTMSLKDFKKVLRSPWGMFIGCFIQFMCMPFLAFIIGRELGLGPEASLALILIGCTPGGTSSNMYTWFARGSVPLSVSMTLVSTLAAVVMMPVLVSFYGGQVSQQIMVPFSQIATSISFVLVPISIGIFLRSKEFPYLKQLQTAGSILGILATLIMLSSWVPRLWEQFRADYFKAYIGVFLLGNLGFILGYFLARSFGFKGSKARTISLETGLQNTLLTFTIMTLSFPKAFVDAVGWIPLVYGASIMGMGLIYVLVFRLMSSKEEVEALEDQELTDWEVFVRRHKSPINLKIHLISASMFWAGAILSVSLWDWRWLIVFLISGPIGSLGHYISGDGKVSFREATHSLDAVHFASKVCLLYVLGQYQRVQDQVEAKYLRLSTTEEV